MSRISRQKLALSGIDMDQLGDEGMARIIRDIIDAGLHGLAFSPYVDGQDNTFEVDADQIRTRLGVLAPHVDWVRTFSCTRGNELTPAIAREMASVDTFLTWPPITSTSRHKGDGTV